MKKLLKVLIIFIILGSILYAFRGNIESRTKPFVFSIYERTLNFTGEIVSQIRITYAPCSEPISYSLGAFDARFGVSKEYFLSALADAEAVWEKPFGGELFVLSLSDGDLKINLIYDYRQQATSKLEGLGITVKNDQATYDNLKTKYDALRNEYSILKNQYDLFLMTFNENNNVFRQEVSYWNKHGGAPRLEYDKLQLEQVSLQTKSNELKSIQAKINELVDEINALAVVLNRLVGLLNLTVDKYNAISVSRGELFEEGVYRSSAGNQEIDIFQFNDREMLVRVLAHELGHAFGLADLYTSACNQETMYGYAGFGEINKRDLNAGDKKGINELY